MMLDLQGGVGEQTPIGVNTFKGSEMRYSLLMGQAHGVLQSLPESTLLLPLKTVSLKLYKDRETHQIIDPLEEDLVRNIALRNRAIDLSLWEVVGAMPTEEMFNENDFAHRLTDGYIDVLAQLTAREEIKMFDSLHPEGLYKIFLEVNGEFEKALQPLFSMSHKVSNWDEMLKKRIEEQKKRLQEKD